MSVYKGHVTTVRQCDKRYQFFLSGIFMTGSKIVDSNVKSQLKLAMFH